MPCVAWFSWCADSGAGSKAVNPSLRPQRHCGNWVRTTDGGTFSSPNYPNTYPPNKECLYVLEGNWWEAHSPAHFTDVKNSSDIGTYSFIGSDWLCGNPMPSTHIKPIMCNASFSSFVIKDKTVILMYRSLTSQPVMIYKEHTRQSSIWKEQTCLSCCRFYGSVLYSWIASGSKRVPIVPQPCLARE